MSALVDIYFRKSFSVSKTRNSFNVNLNISTLLFPHGLLDQKGRYCWSSSYNPFCYQVTHTKNDILNISVSGMGGANESMLLDGVKRTV